MKRRMRRVIGEDIPHRVAGKSMTAAFATDRDQQLTASRLASNSVEFPAIAFHHSRAVTRQPVPKARANFSPQPAETAQIAAAAQKDRTPAAACREGAPPVPCRTRFPDRRTGIFEIGRCARRNAVLQPRTGIRASSRDRGNSHVPLSTSHFLAALPRVICSYQMPWYRFAQFADTSPRITEPNEPRSSAVPMYT